MSAVARCLQNAFRMNRRLLTLCIHYCIATLVCPAGAASSATPPDRFLSGIPLAVIPVHDGLSDTITDELRPAVASALAHQAGIHVVDERRVAEVMAYHGPAASETAAGGALAHAMMVQARAKEHYLNFAGVEAQAEIQNALNEIRAAVLPIQDKGGVLRDALITAAVIAADAKATSMAETCFDEALRIDPGYELDGKAFSPRLKETFSRVKSRVNNGNPGTLNLSSDPKVADVFINGVNKGVTPLQLSLPPGDYSVRVAGNRYTPVDKPIHIQAGQVTALEARLTWQRAVPKPSATSVETEETQALLREGQRLMDVMRLQKVVLLDVDTTPNGAGEIRARMMDGTTKASHRPVVIAFRADRATLPRDMAELVKVLTAQATLKNISNPVAQLEPAGVGDPIVLGRRRGRTITPLGWGVIGGVAGSGAIAGILAAVLSGGGGGGGAGSGLGSVHVQLSK